MDKYKREFSLVKQDDEIRLIIYNSSGLVEFDIELVINEFQTLKDLIVDFDPNKYTELTYQTMASKEDYFPTAQKFSEMQKGAKEAQERIKEIFKNANKRVAYIAITQSKIRNQAIENLLACVDGFMNELGFELKAEEEPVFGSFFQELEFVRKAGESLEKIGELLKKGKNALVYALDRGQSRAEITQQMVDSAVKLINANKEFEEAFILLDQILFVKLTVEGKPRHAIMQMTSELRKEIRSNPDIRNNPREMYQRMVEAGADLM